MLRRKDDSVTEAEHKEENSYCVVSKGEERLSDSKTKRKIIRKIFTA